MEKNEDEKRYLDHRRMLIEGRFQVSASLDKALLMLSGGALGVSMTFVTDIAENPTWTWVLVGAWMLFGLAIGVLLLAMYFCQLAYKKEREDLDASQRRKYDKKQGTKHDEGDDGKHRRNVWSMLTEGGTLLSVVLFLSGIVLVGVFIWVNMQTCVGDRSG